MFPQDNHIGHREGLWISQAKSLYPSGLNVVPDSRGHYLLHNNNNTITTIVGTAIITGFLGWWYVHLRPCLSKLLLADLALPTSNSHVAHPPPSHCEHHIHLWLLKGLPEPHHCIYIILRFVFGICYYTPKSELSCRSMNPSGGRAGYCRQCQTKAALAYPAHVDRCA